MSAMFFFLCTGICIVIGIVAGMILESRSAATTSLQFVAIGVVGCLTYKSFIWIQKMDNKQNYINMTSNRDPTSIATNYDTDHSNKMFCGMVINVNCTCSRAHEIVEDCQQRLNILNCKRKCRNKPNSQEETKGNSKARTRTASLPDLILRIASTASLNSDHENDHNHNRDQDHDCLRIATASNSNMNWNSNNNGGGGGGKSECKEDENDNGGGSGNKRSSGTRVQRKNSIIGDLAGDRIKLTYLSFFNITNKFYEDAEYNKLVINEFKKFCTFMMHEFSNENLLFVINLIQFKQFLIGNKYIDQEYWDKMRFRYQINDFINPTRNIKHLCKLYLRYQKLRLKMKHKQQPNKHLPLGAPPVTPESPESALLDIQENFASTTSTMDMTKTIGAYSNSQDKQNINDNNNNNNFNNNNNNNKIQPISIEIEKLQRRAKANSFDDHTPNTNTSNIFTSDNERKNNINNDINTNYNSDNERKSNSNYNYNYNYIIGSVTLPENLNINVSNNDSNSNNINNNNNNNNNSVTNYNFHNYNNYNNNNNNTRSRSRKSSDTQIFSVSQNIDVNCNVFIPFLKKIYFKFIASSRAPFEVNVSYKIRQQTTDDFDSIIHSKIVFNAQTLNDETTPIILNHSMLANKILPNLIEIGNECLALIAYSWMRYDKPKKTQNRSQTR